MHHLEKVKLAASSCRFELYDWMIARLWNQNPKLSNVFFSRNDVTDADLTSLAQLQHLTNVRLCPNQNVTTSGILTLLRGSSRNVIRKFSIDSSEADDDQVSSEISLMCEERGTTFDAPHAGSIEYVIHS